MNIFINKNNYIIAYVRLVCFGLGIKLTDREEAVLESVAFCNKFSRKEKNKLCDSLDVSVYSVANTLKSLKTKKLIRRVNIDKSNKEERKEYGSYYYSCNFSLPKNMEQLSQSKIQINFVTK